VWNLHELNILQFDNWESLSRSLIDLHGLFFNSIE
jgi:hypothetical protein